MKKNYSILLATVALLAIISLPMKMSGQTRSEVTWTAAGHGYSQGVYFNGETIYIEPSGIILGMFSKSNGSTAPRYYENVPHPNIRMYAKNEFTITPTNKAKISRIVYTFTKANNSYASASVISPEGGTYTPAEVIPSSNNVLVEDTWVPEPAGQITEASVILKLGDSGQRGLVQVTVYYTIDGVGESVLVYNPNVPDGATYTGEMDPETYVPGVTVMVKPCSFECPGYVFEKWTTLSNGTGQTFYPGDYIALNSPEVTLYAQWVSLANGYVSVLNTTNVNEAIGNNSGWCDWYIEDQVDPYIFNYLGRSYRNIAAIQINSNTTSGIVTKVSSGLAAQIVVSWNNSTVDYRKLDVYGSNLPYNAVQDLFGATPGTYLGSIEKGVSNTLVIKDENAQIDLGDFAYIGIRSNSGAVLMDEVRITWLVDNLPDIRFSPTSINLGNVGVGDNLSATFFVSQNNLGGNINLTASHGDLDVDFIERDSEPTQIYWNYTPDNSGLMTETITATSSWTPEGGTPITITKELEITAIVIDPGAGSSIHEAKSAFLADNTNNSATINLANVEVIGQYGNYLYLQDLDAGLLVYGSGAPSFNKGDKFTSGTLSGTLVFYPANNPNGIVELTEFTFVDQSDPDPGQELTVTPTTIADLLNDNSHTYEHRYVELSGVSFDEIVDLNWTLVEGAGSLLLYDRFGVGYATLTPPTVGDLFTVRGVVNPYYANNTLQQQMSPTGLGDIHTTVQAGAPVFTPMGGPQGHAVSTTSVTITPADNTTVEYNINEGDDRLETSQEVTIPITGLTIIEAFASRDFYENSSNYSYYYDLPSNIKSVTFHINGVNGGSVLIEYEHNLTASRCPTVNNIDGYVFRGWSIAPNSTSVITLPYQITANLDLFAVYTLPSSYDYVAISTPSQISAGEYVIVGDDGRDHFYTLKNLHCSSTPMAYPIGDLGLAKVDNKLVGNDYSQVTWTFEGVPSAMTISSTADSDLYLYTTSNATGVRVGYLYEQQTWTFCEDNILNGFFNLKFNPQSRYLTLFDQNTTHDWRCYTLSDMYGANSHPRLTLYKKTPNFTATDPSYTRVFTDEEASQAIIINGPSVIPSGRYLSMGSWPFTNTLGTEMFVIESGATFTPAVGATQTIQATVKKAVTGYGTDNTVKYGWYLLASPVGLVNSNGLVQTGGGQVSGLYGGNDTNYDLYAFDQDPADGLEWRNNKAISGGTSFGNSDGILYASQIDRTITYSGTLVTNFNGQTLACSGNGEFKGWNLIGNPYTCNAYLLDENGEIMPFYRMNDTGDTIVAAQLGTAIKPCEGVFVVCPGDGQAHQAVFTTTAPATVGEAQDDPGIMIPVHALIGNQDAAVSGSTITQTIALSEGVNWVSFYVETNLDALKAALVEALPGTTMKIRSKTATTAYNGNRWRGSLNALDVALMYKVEVSAECEITLEGVPIDPAEHPITITPGLNWIGFPFQSGMTLTDAFAGFAVSGDKIKDKSGASAYNGSRWRGTISNLVPGKGYIYENSTNETKTFVYPSSAKK